MKSILNVFFFLAVAIGSAFTQSNRTTPAIISGILDVRGYDFENSKSLDLNGEWEFYWNELISPGHKTPEKDIHYQTLPGNWNHKQYKGKELPKLGFVVYRLNIISDKEQLLALRFQQVLSSFQVWLNGKMILENGKFGTNAVTTIPRWIPRNIHFQLRPGDNELILYIANYRYYDGGLQKSPILGSPESIAHIQDWKSGLDSFLVGVFLIMAIYHMGLFMLRRKDLSTLYFGLFSLIVGLRAMVTNERLFMEIFPSIRWEFTLGLEFITMPFGVILFLFYIEKLFPKETLRSLVVPAFIINALYFLMVLFTPAWVYSNLLIYYQISLLLFIVSVLLVIIMAGIRKRQGAWMVLGGFFFLFAAVINDILFVNDVIHTGHMLPYGVFIFIFSQAFILSMRFSQAFHAVEDMTGKLKVYNQNLSEIVESRTQELQQERNLLKQRNETMEFELDLARKIQMDLIPSERILDNLDFFYKPMEKVGGDFYDFIQYPDPDLIGIFISDVSGHGVPAALVTSMIKSTLLQVSADPDDPAALLSQLNQTLSNKTAGHFVTAFYGILNVKTGMFNYSNAGHNLPFIITSDDTQILKSEYNGLPLSILTNQELTDFSKSYTNNSITLVQKSKLFLYTDGLMEAVRKEQNRKMDQVEDFEANTFLETVNRIKDLPSQFFIKEMALSLIDFRGSDVFDDDVCMICVEVG